MKKKKETSKKALHNCLYECEDGGQLESCWEKRPHIRRPFSYSPDHRESHSDSNLKGFMCILAITVKAIKDYLLKYIEIQCYLSYYLITNFCFLNFVLF